MKKAIAIVLLTILVVTFLKATSKKKEELNKKLESMVMLGDIDEVKRLIKAGADVHHRFDFGATKDVTVIVFAVMSDTAEMVKVLIDSGANVNEKYEGDTTLLHLACRWDLNDTAVTEVLIAAGLDVNAKINKGSLEGETPLHLSAAIGNMGVAEVLIKNGADVNARKANGETPLDLAISKEHKELAELLRKHGGISKRK
jgi:ankyrin repeat protein